MRFNFPDIVDEITIRLIAAQVLVVTVVAALGQWWWLYALLAIDFALRVGYGPRFSPTAHLAGLIRRRLGRPPRPTSGPPKRFAATIGLVCSLLLLAFAGLGWTAATWVIAVAMIVFPALESILGFCVGCQIFGLLIRAGLIPERVCLDCADISRRLRTTSG